MSNVISRSSENALIDQMDRLAGDRAAIRMARRKFLAGLGIAGAAAATGVALTGCSSDGPLALTGTVTPSVLDVLNFALNLEYLESSFYLYATSGSGLTAADMGSNPGTVTGGAKVALVNPYVVSAASQLATDEREHVEFLRSTITSVGGTPVSMPNINLAAGGTVNSDATFLAAARQLENVGVSAYIGGAAFLASSTVALTYAAQILDTEAQHAGLIRELCVALNVTSPAVDSQDNPPTMTKLFDTSATTGLAPVRTTSQVLQIVYAAAGMTGISKGGFYPNGMNGTIATS